MQKMEVAVLFAAACDFDFASAVVVEIALETRARGGVLRRGRARVIRAAMPGRIICTISWVDPEIPFGHPYNDVTDQGSAGFKDLPHAERRETEGKVMALARAF